MSDPQIAADFNLYELPPGFVEDPYPVYAALREQAPLKRFEDGSVMISRWAEMDRKRHLYRLWIRNEDLRPLPRQVRDNLLGIEVDGFTPSAPLDATEAA